MVQDVAAQDASEPCSYRDRVFLDQPSVDSWVITDIVLQKQHKLGSGTFQLEFDEAGHNCIVQDKYDKDRFFDCDDLFGELFVKKSGLGDIELIHQKFDKSKNDIVHTNMTEMFCKFKQVNLVANMRYTSAKDSLSRFIMYGCYGFSGGLGVMPGLVGSVQSLHWCHHNHT